MAINIEQAPFELNLAEELDTEELKKLGHRLKQQIEIDEDSRREWIDTNKNWLKLAAQVREEKSFPWPGASNVKYPLLTIASMQFHARALPNLINSNKPVRMRTLGQDPEQEKSARAQRVSTYMSYQILEGLDDWMDDMDRLLFVLPMVGICYKKTYFSESEQRIKSVLVLPNDLIINYHARSFEKARMTQVMYMDSNEIHELQASGVFLDIEIQDSEEPVDMNRHAMDDIDDVKNTPGSNMLPYEIYESHCWEDLDGDGYKEPYIVILTKKGEVLRVAARWSDEAIDFNPKGDVIRIKPDEYYTPYIFMPDPASAVSGLGLGTLLGPINEATNTLINQLIDAGTLSTLQAGFLGKGMKLRGGSSRFRPGEWKIVNSTGDDIRKNVFPMPVREPSTTLFQLLGTLIDSGDRISSVSEMLTGESPGQNQPATTTMAVLEQGLQLFSSIYKRQHRSLAREYMKIYNLNRDHLNVQEYNAVLDEDLKEPGAIYTVDDFEDESADIKPASDPSIVSQAQKSVKSQALLEKLAIGLPLNVEEVTRRTLEAEDQENIKLLMTVQPQPNPEAELQMAQFEHQREMDLIQAELDALKIRAQAVKDETGAELNIAKAQEIGVKAELSERDQTMKEVQAEAGIITDRIKAMNETKKVENDKQRNSGSEKS